MKSVKKIFVAFFALFLGIMLVSATTKAKAYSKVPNSTPWILTFEDGTVVNIREGETGGFSVYSNSFTVTYFDATGKTEGGYLNLFTETRHMETYKPYIIDQYIQNGETITVEKGGTMTLVYEMPSDEGDWTTNVWYSFYVNRSIIDTNRIQTNLVDGKYYYNHSIWFEDIDDERMLNPNMEWEVYNKTTGEIQPGYSYFYVDKAGEYEVTVYDKGRDETLTYEFAIDKADPLIYLVERDYLTETPMENGAITSAGMEVIYGDNYEVKEMTYLYKPFSGRWETGTVKSGFIFYRKGEYTITVTDMAGNRSVATFTITDYDLVVDPEGAQTVGTEVTSNGGAYGDPTMSVGYTRCIYLGPTAPSQSRLDYTFTSSDESIATVSVFGTVEAKGAGTVKITCVHKKTGKVSKIVITVLP
ncbi:MAG: Ig-like domain-containing protein [Prevotella sp.]|nr:Ig-like domain-containing protein [Staphylococcus sp.]MCM1350522.1 Ig-like domain-containing protein [Prevotella sp.]